MTNATAYPRLAEAGSVRDAVAAATAALADAGVESARNDAEVLTSFSLGCDRRQLWQHLDEPPPPSLPGLITRRARREPLQHITGEAHFRYLTVQVGAGVFVPRPETEVIVDEALSLLDEAAASDSIVVDLCAGSGAIALAIATERPGTQVHAVEISPDALPWLRRNVEAAGVQVHGVDVADPPVSLLGRVDLVVANPPYIPSAAVPREPEVAKFDPEVALYSGVDGLDHIRIVERTAARLLRGGGWVVVEHSDQQGESAPAVFTQAEGWSEVLDHPDLTGRDRFLTARRSSAPGVD